MGFTTRLRTDCYDPENEIGDGEFLVVSPLVYEASSGSKYAVPMGFITDFASIPKLVRLMPGFDVNGRSRAAAVLHDFLYSSHGFVCDQSKDAGYQVTHQHLTRAQCDALFREALLSLGVGRGVAYSMWLGVRTGGWMYWKKREDGLVQTYDMDVRAAYAARWNADDEAAVA